MLRIEGEPWQPLLCQDTLQCSRVCSPRPLQARLCLQKRRKQTTTTSGILVTIFLAPALKLTEIKTGICCKGTNAAKCQQLLAFCCNCVYPCGFTKLLSSPRIFFPAIEYSCGAGGKQQLFHRAHNWVVWDRE